MNFSIDVLDGKHPHVRGEDTTYQQVQVADQETPPRAWGRLYGNPGTSEQQRNTPTCVGKTIHQHSLCLFQKKHPHVRGEDFHPRHDHFPPVETPPRAWGRLRNTVEVSHEHRNTPTCVGKTSFLHGEERAVRKHPHVRGEDTERLFTFFIEPSKQY